MCGARVNCARCGALFARPEGRWEGAPWPSTGRRSPQKKSWMRQARWWPCDRRQLRPSGELDQPERRRCPRCRVASSCLVCEKVFFVPSQQVLEAALLPERETLGHLSCCSQARGTSHSRSFDASSRHCHEPCPASTARPRQSCASDSSSNLKIRKVMPFS